jgi:hypothetical protein
MMAKAAGHGWLPKGESRMIVASPQMRRAQRASLFAPIERCRPPIEVRAIATDPDLVLPLH